MTKKNFFTLAIALLLLSGIFLNIDTASAQQRTIISEDDAVEAGEIVPEAKSNKALYTITILGLLLVAGGALYLFWVQTQPAEVQEQKPKPKPKPRPKPQQKK